MTKSEVWSLRVKPSGIPKEEDFKCSEEELPLCQDGEFITEAEILSVDPYMRYLIELNDIKEPITGSQVAKVIESKNNEYPVGTYVLGYLGWRTLTHISQERLQLPDVSSALWKLADLGEIPRAAALGILGMPGNTAYFGLLEVCKPKPGETVLVNAAAGAVGSLVCQIAKLVGCTVIGFAGTDEKVAWLKELGIDHAFNYKTKDVSQSLKLAAPEGIDCFFDNVGGRFAADALPHMTMFGRVAICGCISALNLEGVDLSSPSLTSPYSAYFLITKQLKVEGFLVSRWADRWTEGIFQMKEWLLQGKLKYKETRTIGFENMPRAFIGLFRGENIGKAIVFR